MQQALTQSKAPLQDMSDEDVLENYGTPFATKFGHCMGAHTVDSIIEQAIDQQIDSVIDSQIDSAIDSLIVMEPRLRQNYSATCSKDRN